MDATRDPQSCDISVLNTLLGGEMAAVDTYTHTVGRFSDQMLIADLQQIRDEHGRAVRLLRDALVRFGGQPAGGAGQGASASAAATAAEEISPATALASLRQGEERAVSEYQTALENSGLHPDCQRMIRTDLMPACRKHIEELNRLLGGMDH